MSKYTYLKTEGFLTIILKSFLIEVEDMNKTLKEIKEKIPSSIRPNTGPR